MSVTNIQKAEVLIQALPYIQKYNNQIVVVKYGGSSMVNSEMTRSVMGDLVLLWQIGIKVVLVHGGGPEITQTLKKMGKESKFINGLRQTDAETADVVQMVLAGKINKSLVADIESLGGKAIGLCGIDGSMIEASKINDELGFVGDVENINTDIIFDVIEKGYIPVISTVGFDKKGNVYNINADTVSSRIASELKAYSFITMTDAKGILRNQNDESSLISTLNVSEAPQLINEGIISGGMIPKVKCCIDAIRRGVKKVFIIDGRVPHSLLIEVLSDEGIGTMFE